MIVTAMPVLIPSHSSRWKGWMTGGISWDKWVKPLSFRASPNGVNVTPSLLHWSWQSRNLNQEIMSGILDILTLSQNGDEACLLFPDKVVHTLRHATGCYTSTPLWAFKLRLRSRNRWVVPRALVCSRIPWWIWVIGVRIAAAWSKSTWESHLVVTKIQV